MILDSPGPPGTPLGGLLGRLGGFLCELGGILGLLGPSGRSSGTILGELEIILPSWRHLGGHLRSSR
eukprot:3089084-Pyramimonas_sp.AAC.1